jgi:hypothetical protein
MNRVRAGNPRQLDDLAILRREPADTVCFFSREVTVTFTTPRIRSNVLVNFLLLLLFPNLAAGERFERPCPDSKSMVLPLDDPASRSERDCFHAPYTQHRRFVDVMTQSRAIRTRTIHQFAVISSSIAVEFRCKLDLKTFEFNHLCAHNLVAARRIEFPSQP